MSKQETANNFAAGIARKYLGFAYRRRIADFKRHNPAAFLPRPIEAERSHLALWKSLSRHPSLEWYRFFANVSGRDDARYVSEDIYHSLIERVLNDMNYAWVFADKNFYDRHLNPELFPRTILRNISGEYWDADFRLLSNTRAREIFEAQRSDLVVKPSIDSGGGKNVKVLQHDTRGYCSADGRIWDFNGIQKAWDRDFLIQERIFQHADYSAFNPSSVNTVRLMTLRSPVTGQVVPLKGILRMGIGSIEVDNEKAGGVSVGILRDGMLNDYACTKYGDKLAKHPASNLHFTGYKLPHFDRMLAVCSEIASQVPSQRLLSFDMTVDQHGTPRILEINTFGQGIHFVQTFDGGLFGEQTGEIIDFCHHCNSSRFKHIRLIA